jgi:hypothetical protein
MPESLNIRIYEGNGEINSQGYNKDTRGGICFLAEDRDLICEYRGDSRTVAEGLVVALRECLMVSTPPFSSINFSYGDSNMSIPIFADGFFGRPVIVVGAFFLKPVRTSRRKRLVEELKRVGYAQDKKGRRIHIDV